jgi:hypothetical protein
MSSPPELPVDQPAALARLGRLTLWRLGQRQQARALRRQFPHPIIWGKGGWARRWLDLVAPWSVTEYPGRYRALGQRLGVKPGYAKKLATTTGAIPAKHLDVLETDLRERAAQMLALADQMAAERRRRDETAVRHPWQRCGGEKIEAKRARLRQLIKRER